MRRRVGVTFGQWKVLAMLSRQNGLTQKEIADRLGLEAPTLIPIIDKMEEGEFVVRKVDHEDRRINRIYLTNKAEALWDQMVECALRIRKVSVSDIPEEQITIMINILEMISKNLMIAFRAPYTNINSVTAATAPQRKKIIN